MHDVSSRGTSTIVFINWYVLLSHILYKIGYSFGQSSENGETLTVNAYVCNNYESYCIETVVDG